MTESEIFAVKEAVRTRDGRCCTECGMTREEHLATFGSDLDVHRLEPGSLYTEAGCTTLCKFCHGPKPKRPYGSVEERHTISLSAAEYEALRLLAERNHRPLLWQLRLILHEALAEEGLWPPPPASPS